MAALPSQMLDTPRPVCRLQTVFSARNTSSNPASSLSSPAMSSATFSSAEYACFDQRLNSSTAQLAAMSPNHQSTEHGLASAAQLPWRPDTWCDSPALPAAMSRNGRRVIRKKKSQVEIRQQEERQQVRGDLLGLIEPRPGAGVTSGGIEEVLHGDV